MAVTELSAIPDPSPDLNSLYEAVVSLKQTVEVLTGQRGTGTYKYTSKADMTAQQNLAGADPSTALSNLGLNAAWVSYTPTITAGAGTFTTVSAAGKYAKVGKTVFVHLTITITTNGTAATYVSASTPVDMSSNNFTFYGRDITNGKMVQGIKNTSSTILIVNYDNSYPGADGHSIALCGVYETP